MFLLKKYEDASGQKINLTKSKISFSQNVSSVRQNELLVLLNVKAMASSMT